jgi:hypothetical protein
MMSEAAPLATIGEQRALAWRSAVPPAAASRDPAAMSQTCSSRRRRAERGALPDDLYIVLAPRPRIGRPIKHAVERWTVTDDWPDPIPVGNAKLDVFEAWFGDLFDELFGPS